MTILVKGRINVLVPVRVGANPSASIAGKRYVLA